MREKEKTRIVYIAQIKREEKTGLIFDKKKKEFSSN